MSTPPVGLCGELRMISFVRGVTSERELVDVEPEVVLLAERDRDRACRPTNAVIDS